MISLKRSQLRMGFPAVVCTDQAYIECEAFLPYQPAYLPIYLSISRFAYLYSIIIMHRDRPLTKRGFAGWSSCVFMLNCEEKMCRLERRMNGFAYFKATLLFLTAEYGIENKVPFCGGDVDGSFLDYL